MASGGSHRVDGAVPKEMRADRNAELSKRGLSNDLPYVGVRKAPTLGGRPKGVRGLKEKWPPAFQPSVNMLCQNLGYWPFIRTAGLRLICFQYDPPSITDPAYLPANT